MRAELGGFDFQSGVYYYNVGEGLHRNWADMKGFGFISAGGGKRWRDAIRGFQEGDVAAAYLKGKGFVGIGKVLKRARPVREVMVSTGSILSCGLTSHDMNHDLEDDEKCEWVALVEWLCSVDASHAKRAAKKDGIYTTTHVRASLAGQPATIEFLANVFEINMLEMIR